MEFESFNEGTLYTSVFKKEMQHLLTAYFIIGPEGTDISGIADNYKAKGSDESTEPARS
jgi:pyruvate dehydrogenase E2 component (dihydrolipoamide acetyltransferase)